MNEAREVITREAVGSVESAGDGRTLELRVVPWNTPTRVTDNGRDFYVEEWLPGCFDRQVAAANRVDVLMNFEHERGIGGVIGRGTTLRNAKSGFEGIFRMLTGSDADKALELVNEGILTGVSLEAQPLESLEEDGVVKRVKARLVNIALCRAPAFSDAQVLAVREAKDEEAAEESAEAHEDDEQPPSDVKVQLDGEAAVVKIGDEQPADRTNEVDELLARVGYEPLTRRAVTRKPWNGSASKYADTDAYCAACLIDDNPAGAEKTQARCHLPVLEPNGDVNANALSAAAGRLNQTQSPSKGKAARKLVRLYRQAGMEVPPSLQSAASR